MILSVTGHRPVKIPGYNYDIIWKLEKLAESFLLEHKPTQLITGMALGWDTICAEVAIRYDISLIAAIPHPAQCRSWPGLDIEIWKRIVDYAKQTGEVHHISRSYSPQAMQVRNEWMVDRADHVLALWSGQRGGTENCISYARRKGKPVTNLWPQFIGAV